MHTLGTVICAVFLVVFLIALYMVNERDENRKWARQDKEHHCEHCRLNHPFIGDDINITLMTRDKDTMVMVMNSDGTHLFHNVKIVSPPEVK